MTHVTLLHVMERVAEGTTLHLIGEIAIAILLVVVGLKLRGIKRVAILALALLLLAHLFLGVGV